MTHLDALPPTGAEVLDREAVRALVIDDAQRVLLFVGQDPHRPERGSWWFTPGGGLRAEESERDGLVREIREETGLLLDPDAIGAPVWFRQAEFLFAGQWYRQRERFFVVRVGAHAVDTSGFEPLEALAVLGHRWWALEDLAGSHDVVYPRALKTDLLRLLTDGPPAQPYEVD